MTEGRGGVRRDGDRKGGGGDGTRSFGTDMHNYR